ncbi:MAG: Hint domain-containing protein, partial [Halobacteria archaeon]|nr:Hint domain-containing protein [Halobacteria archaeon]
REIREIVEAEIPEAVETETPADTDVDVYTYNRDDRRTKTEGASKVWRMPERECHEIETARGKAVEASRGTPVLTCGDGGLEWKEINDVEEGEYVASPVYTSVERTSPSPVEFVEFENELIDLSESSRRTLVDALKDEYGTLRGAADELGFPEPFVYDTLQNENRAIPYPRLERVLEATGKGLEDLDVESVSLRHGHDFRLPTTSTTT